MGATDFQSVALPTELPGQGTQGVARPVEPRQQRRRASRLASLGERLAFASDRSGGAGACWIWQGSVTNDGYGTLSWRGRDIGAHRAALELSLGRALAPDEVTRHGKGCPRTCVNPAHLRPGTRADNSRDMIEHGRSPCGERSGNAKLTEAQVSEIRERAAGMGYGRFEMLGREYGVTGKQISNIVHGARWAHSLADRLIARLESGDLALADLREAIALAVAR